MRPLAGAMTLLLALAPIAGPAAQTADEPIAIALAHPERLAGDRTADPRRKPGIVLEFFGIEPGMTVLDLYSGGGYYTEILARVVGEEGRVVAHNNTPYLEYSKDQLAQLMTASLE